MDYFEHQGLKSMQGKAMSAACFVTLLIGIIIGAYAVERVTPSPQPAPIPAPVPDRVPDTPAPEKAIELQVGELLRLTIPDSGRVAWTVEPPIPDLVTFGDRNESSVTSYRAKGRYTIIAAVVVPSAGYNDQVTIKRYTVVVGGASPAPTPVPTPGPSPEPTPVPGPTPTPAISDFTGLVSIVPDAAGAAKLAASFRGVAKEIQGMIDERKLMSPDDIVELTKVSNNEALGSSVSKWEPFFAASESVLNKLAKDGKLLTMQDHVDRWLELATVLESVR